MQNDEIIILRKRITYHVSRRANLELETILKHFWSQYRQILNYEQLRKIEEFLNTDDLDLLEMIVGLKPAPLKEWQEIIALIRSAWNSKRAP